jgi:hypothetical protein
MKARAKPTVEKDVESLADLKPDPANLRLHNPRNIGMIVDALHQVGAARSIVIDEDNTVLAGNGLIEAAAEAGITKLQVIEADGETVVAVRRRGLSTQQKRRLALFDNRTSELSEWDMGALCENTADIQGLFTPAELDELVEQAQHHAAFDEQLLTEDRQAMQGQVDLSPRLHESYNYVVLLFRNDIDWAAAMDHFKLTPLADPTNSKIGIGRVLEGSDYLRNRKA